MTVRASSTVSLDKRVVSTPIPPFKTSSPPTDPLLATIQKRLPHQLFFFFIEEVKEGDNSEQNRI
jgi:hypothetical protein